MCIFSTKHIDALRCGLAGWILLGAAKRDQSLNPSEIKSNETRQQQPNKQHRQGSDDTVTPNVTTKISTDHAMATGQKMCFDRFVVVLGQFAHCCFCTCCKCGAYCRRLFFQLGRFEFTSTSLSNVAVFRKVWCNTPCMNCLGQGRHIDCQHLGGLRAVSTE